MLGEKETSMFKEVKRSRTDLSYTLMAQLTSPLYDFSLMSCSSTSTVDPNKASETSNNLNENISAKEVEVNTNLSEMLLNVFVSAVMSILTDSHFNNIFIVIYFFYYGRGSSAWKTI